MPEPTKLVSLPLCPLSGIPPVQRAWSVKRGDTIILRFATDNPEVFEAARPILDEASKRTDIEFILLTSGVEVVPPGGDDA
jgi:hypothetical protein